LTLQVDSNQIKENIRNHHESIGLYEVGFWVGNLALVVLAFPLFVSFSLWFGAEQEWTQIFGM